MKPYDLTLQRALVAATKPPRIMYAVTHIAKDGMRVLSFPNQGRHHYDTPEAAYTMIEAMIRNNSRDTLESVYGGPVGVASLEVRAIPCYEHGDAMGIYSGRIILIKKLVGIAPVLIDQRSRNADGSLMYPNQTPTPRHTMLRRVWFKQQQGETWLYWQWDKSLNDPFVADYSGIAGSHPTYDNYALEVIGDVPDRW